MSFEGAKRRRVATNVETATAQLVKYIQDLVQSTDTVISEEGMVPFCQLSLMLGQEMGFDVTIDESSDVLQYIYNSTDRGEYYRGICKGAPIFSFVLLMGFLFRVEDPRSINAFEPLVLLLMRRNGWSKGPYVSMWMAIVYSQDHQIISWHQKAKKILHLAFSRTNSHGALLSQLCCHVKQTTEDVGVLESGLTETDCRHNEFAAYVGPVVPAVQRLEQNQERSEQERLQDREQLKDMAATVGYLMEHHEQRRQEVPGAHDEPFPRPAAARAGGEEQQWWKVAHLEAFTSHSRDACVSALRHAQWNVEHAADFLYSNAPTDADEDESSGRRHSEHVRDRGSQHETNWLLTTQQDDGRAWHEGPTSPVTLLRVTSTAHHQSLSFSSASAAQESPPREAPADAPFGASASRGSRRRPLPENAAAGTPPGYSHAASTVKKKQQSAAPGSFDKAEWDKRKMKRWSIDDTAPLSPCTSPCRRGA